MKKRILIILFLIHSVIFAQNPQTTFHGIFETNYNDPDYKYTNYNKFHFDGKGHVLINDTISGIFIEDKNKLYIASQIQFFFFKIEPNKIVRFDEFDNNLNYFKKNQTQDSTLFDSSKVNAKLLYEYISYEYDLKNFESNLLMFTENETYLSKMQSLCKSGLDIACESYIEGIRMNQLRDAFANNTEFEFKQNTEIENICILYAKFNPGKAYYQLSIYYASIKNIEKAKHYFELTKQNADSFLTKQLIELENIIK